MLTHPQADQYRNVLGNALARNGCTQRRTGSTRPPADCSSVARTALRPPHLTLAWSSTPERTPPIASASEPIRWHYAASEARTPDGWVASVTVLNGRVTAVVLAPTGRSQLSLDCRDMAEGRAWCEDRVQERQRE